MQQTNFRENRPTGSGEEEFEGFYNVLAGRSSLSCDQDPVKQHLFPLPMEAPHKSLT